MFASGFIQKSGKSAEAETRDNSTISQFQEVSLKIYMHCALYSSFLIFAIQWNNMYSVRDVLQNIY